MPRERAEISEKTVPSQEQSAADRLRDDWQNKATTRNIAESVQKTNIVCKDRTEYTEEGAVKAAGALFLTGALMTKPYKVMALYAAGGAVGGAIYNYETFKKQDICRNLTQAPGS